jgi:hypothetical protein
MEESLVKVMLASVSSNLSDDKIKYEKSSFSQNLAINQEDLSFQVNDLLRRSMHKELINTLFTRQN